MNLREDEPLYRHTTLRTGGPARFFVEATTEAEVQEAIQFAQARGLPLLVLGSGSNVLANDAGFDGLVLKLATRGIQTTESPAGATEVCAEAGEAWDALVAYTVARGLFGLENMSLIPGTVGAAVVGNIGAYGAEVKQSLVWAEALDRRTGARRRFAPEEADFGYRRSFFKTPEGRNYLVTRAAFCLKKQATLDTSYKDLEEYFATRKGGAATLETVRAAVIDIRRRKLPDLAAVGTAGSFFKNPVISRAAHKALAQRYPGLPGHDEGDGLVKVPLGWILDKVCGLKGVRHGRVGTHSDQALVIVNEGGSTTEVEALANEMARKVREVTGIEVEWEVEKV